MVKQGLRNLDLKTKIGLILKRGTNREGEKREEEKRKKRKKEGSRPKRYGCLTLVWNFGFCMDHMEL